MTVALERVSALVSCPADGETAGDVTAGAAAVGGTPGKRRRGRVDDATVQRAVELLKDRPELAGPGKGAEMARALGVSESTGRRVLKQVTAGSA